MTSRRPPAAATRAVDVHRRLIAREYLRVSVDRSGRTRSVDEQHGENADAADRHDWDLGEAYVDNSVSASRYSRKARKGFAQLLADLRDGTFGADVLIIWESSRGSRKPAEWEQLFELCEAAGVCIYVTTHGRLYDPANARDLRSMREDAVDSAYESDKTSSRVKRDADASAARGDAWGKIPYGYRRERDERTGKPVAQVENETTGPIVREIHKRLLAGQSIKSVTTWLNESDVPSPLGRIGGWSRTTVRTIGISPTYAGLRTSYGEVTSAAQWPPLIAEADHHKLVARLTDPARSKGRGDGAVKHLLSHLAECECGGKMRRVADSKTHKLYYTCEKNACSRVGKDWLDLFVETAVLEYLGRRDAAEAFAEKDNPAAELSEEVRTLRARLESAYAEFTEGELSAKGLSKVEAMLAPKIKTAEDRMRTQITVPVLSELIGPGIEQRWTTRGIEQKREVIRAVARVVVCKVARNMRRKVQAKDRVTIEWLRDTPTAGAA